MKFKLNKKVQALILVEENSIAYGHDPFLSAGHTQRVLLWGPYSKWNTRKDELRIPPRVAENLFGSSSSSTSPCAQFCFLYCGVLIIRILCNKLPACQYLSCKCVPFGWLKKGVIFIYFASILLVRSYLYLLFG